MNELPQMNVPEELRASIPFEQAVLLALGLIAKHVGVTDEEYWRGVAELVKYRSKQ